MKTKKLGRTLPLAAALVLLGLAAGASAQQNSGYLTDQRGVVVKSGFGLCWRTSNWTPALATEECDPDLVPKKVTPAPAPSSSPAPRAAPAPAPAPRPAPVTQKITLSADTLFDFNKAVIRPDGKVKLDELYGKTRDVNIETVIAVGHADRFGSVGYNMKLSKHRADAVKSYLVSRGIPANRIYTEGKGKSQPVTKPGQCKGPRSAKVIRCLQPDRRVDIELVGTRNR